MSFSLQLFCLSFLAVWLHHLAGLVRRSGVAAHVALHLAWRRKRIERAFAVCQQLIAHAGTLPVIRGRAHLVRAAIRLNRQQPEEALQDLEQVLQLRPGLLPSVTYLRAVALTLLERGPEARDAATLALVQLTRRSHARMRTHSHALRAACALQAGDARSAWSDLQQLPSDHPTRRRLQVQVLSRLGLYQQALACLRETGEPSPRLQLATLLMLSDREAAAFWLDRHLDEEVPDPGGCVALLLGLGSLPELHAWVDRRLAERPGKTATLLCLKSLLLLFSGDLGERPSWLATELRESTQRQERRSQLLAPGHPFLAAPTCAN